MTVEDDFVSVRDGRFYLRDKPYYFMGANLWYSAYLGAGFEEGGKERLIRELDFLEKYGIKNLRILAASEASELDMSLSPAIQVDAGRYSEQLLQGLDFTLAEMRKRDMRAVLFLNNFWQWSGGMSQYVAWVTGKPVIDPDITGDWPGFIQQSASFYDLPDAQVLYRKLIDSIILRQNTITGFIYRDDPTIMSWQLANEPRPGNHNQPRASYQSFVNWIEETAKYIRKIDPNHLISTGSEGTWGTVDDEQLFIDAHKTPYIDYLTFHLWVKNWSWFDAKRPLETYEQALANTKSYIKQQINIAAQLKKPTVMEEFGVERDDGDYRKSSSTVYRDKFFQEYFQIIYQEAANGRPVMGVNFWAWGGFGQAQHSDLIWREGDPFVGDPPQEPQGLNSVFAGDVSTLDQIKKYSDFLQKLSTSN